MEYSSAKSDLPSLWDDVLISIQPQHAERLYAGEKTFELRKTIPRVVPRRIFLYETNHVRAIRGHLIVERVLRGSPPDIWQQVGTSAASKRGFASYFSGRSIAFAFEVGQAVRYRSEITAADLLRIEPGFRPSQNFLYLQNLPALKAHLQELAFFEGFSFSGHGIDLKPLADQHEERFLAEVTTHISGAYRETQKAYGIKLVMLDRAGRDYEGVFTRRKAIREIWRQGELIGFVVFTEKLGGGVKTGPTVLFEGSQGKGIGQHLREVIHTCAHRIGARKVYCTAPFSKEGAIKYLLGAGYRIEAHLLRQYHDMHDELVFGYMIAKYRAPGQDFVRPVVPVHRFERVTRWSPAIANFLREEFSAAFVEVNYDWAMRQVREAIAWAKGRGSQFKARVLFVASGLGIGAMALCVLKRGGGCKITILSRTAHRRTLGEFLVQIEKKIDSSRRLRCEKKYTHLPIQDVDLIQVFVDNGYRPEGVLERPYNDSADFVVLGKNSAHSGPQSSGARA